MPLHMRLPKLKGFNNRFRVEYQVVNVDRSPRCSRDGGAVGRRTTWSRRRGPHAAAGQGARQRRPRRRELDVTAHAFSASAAGEDRRGRRQHHRSLVPAGPAGSRPALLGSAARVPRPRSSATGGAADRSLTASLATDAGGCPCSALSRRRSGRRTSAEDALHAGDHRGLPARVASCPSPGVVVPARSTAASTRRRPAASATLLADQPVLRRRAAPAVGLRAGHHALHHGEHHRPAAVVVIPRFEQLKKEGPVGSEQADPVHPLPDDRAGDPAVHRHHRPRPQRPAVPQLQRADHPDRTRS